MDPKSLFSISRKDSDRDHGWWVRLGYRKKVPSIQKSFSDLQYGGPGEALIAAIQFRDSTIEFEGLVVKRRGSPLENLENSKSKKVKEEWRQERIRRRLVTIKITGRKKIHVGTGIEAAKKAREYGAGKITCWKIRSGKQDFYTVYNFMPGVDLVWKGRENLKNADMEQQKKFGKKKVVIGTGIEAAKKAQEMGASSSTCSRILRGKQTFFYCCFTIPHFEANGFKRELTQEVIDKINSLAHRFARDNPLDVAAEAMINYASADEIPDDEESFIQRLVFKYKRILEMEDTWYRAGRNMISLDVSGDVVWEKENNY